MIGAIFGDIIGSVYEHHNVKTEDFPLFCWESQFTDDTVLTVAVSKEVLIRSKGASFFKRARKDYALWYKQYYKRYPKVGYGQMFSEWAETADLTIQRSYGNGGAMRCIPIAYCSNELKEVWREIGESCYYTHHNREAITGAKALATAVFLARIGSTKKEIKREVERRFSYSLDFSLEQIRKNYVFNSRTSYCVPPAIVAFLESNCYEDAIRKAISIGGDSDTIACMAGGIAQAFYQKIPKEIQDTGFSRLDVGLRKDIREFCEYFHIVY